MRVRYTNMILRNIDRRKDFDRVGRNMATAFLIARAAILLYPGAEDMPLT